MKKLDVLLYGSRKKPIAALLGMVLVMPFIISSPYIFTILILIGIYSIITIGLSLLVGYAGQISLGHAAFFAIGAYFSGVLTVKYSFSPWLAILIGMIITFISAFLIAIPVMKLKGSYLALATMAINIIIYILLLGLSDYTGGASGLGGIPPLSIFGLSLESQVLFYYFVWFIVSLVIVFTSNIVRSHIGRILRSIHDSEVATETLGANVSKYKVAIFALSAVFASLAGSLYAHFISFIAPPTFYINFSILLLIMVMVGGVHSIWGAMIGTAVMMALNELIRFVGHNYLNISGEIEIVVYGAIIVIVMIFMPKGLIHPLSKLRFKKLTRTQKNETSKQKLFSEKGV
jgi:branched-chain amino acid transport system permease protein